MKKIQVGFLMSYDYDKLKDSLPQVYDEADEIFIALDHKRRTWSGNYFSVDDSFFVWLKEFDVKNKITLYEDDFYDATISPIENDNRERRMLSEKMQVGNWLIQIDSDEYFMNFKKFIQDLRKYDKFLDNPEKNKIQISVYSLNMYKYSDGGVLFVTEPTKALIATNYPNYKVARKTKERIIYTDNIMLHECVAREEKDIVMKFDNWGHKDEVRKDDFLEKWRKVNKSNYKNYENFFYIEPEKWKKLEFVKGNNPKEIEKNLDYSIVIPSGFYIWKKNFGQWFKFLFK